MSATRATLNKVHVGDAFPTLSLTATSGQPVAVPDDNGKLVHLQFRRYAGCPICNVHLRSIVERHAEIVARGIREVVVFHSTVAELAKYQPDLPFAAVADPERTLYRRFGVEHTSRAILNPIAARVAAAGVGQVLHAAIVGHGTRHPINPTGGRLGLPADFLVSPDGSVAAVKYGQHAYDQWSVDELLAHASSKTA